MNRQQLLVFEISDQCNLAATHAAHCPISEIRRPPGRPLSDDEILECVRTAYREMGFRGLIAWHWYCEPMLQWDRLRSLMAKIKTQVPEAGFLLWTNGTILPDNLKDLSIFSKIVVTAYREHDWNSMRRIAGLNVLTAGVAFDARLSPPAGDSAFCLRPFVELVVDYQGNGRLCCVDWKRPARGGDEDLGNVQQASFREVAGRFLRLRDQIATGRGPDRCRHCALAVQSLDGSLASGPAEAARAHVAAGCPQRVALCVIATGKYVRFVSDLLESAEKHFCAGHDVQFFVFTNADGGVNGGPWAVGREDKPQPTAHHTLPTPHEPWPGPTLHRYRTMLRAKKDLLACDYVYYCDVDSRFVRPVGNEIFGDLVATIHFGFAEKPWREWTLEGRLGSRACIAAQDRRRLRHYYCGGFQGGRAAVFVAAMRAMDAAIAADESRGVTACWHDESHWNRYLIDHPPTRELSHDYMCPATWRPDSQRIVIVGKNNEEVRRIQG